MAGCASLSFRTSITWYRCVYPAWLRGLSRQVASATQAGSRRPCQWLGNVFELWRHARQAGEQSVAAAVAADARALLVLEALHRESAVLIHLTQVRLSSSGPV